MKSIYILLLLSLNLGCHSENDDRKESPIGETTAVISNEDSALLAEVNARPDVEPIRLHHYTEADVAKFTMAAVMGQRPEIISATKSGGPYIVSYTRPSDGQRFTYKVKIDDFRAIWANIDGRCRDTQDDERITYSEVGKKMKIVQSFSDGSSDEKLYSSN